MAAARAAKVFFMGRSFSCDIQNRAMSSMLNPDLGTCFQEKMRLAGFTRRG
jgi:hypothetical protein